jgi:hypothetical protein
LNVSLSTPYGIEWRSKETFPVDLLDQIAKLYKIENSYIHKNWLELKNQAIAGHP